MTGSVPFASGDAPKRRGPWRRRRDHCVRKQVDLPEDSGKLADAVETPRLTPGIRHVPVSARCSFYDSIYRRLEAPSSPRTRRRMETAFTETGPDPPAGCRGGRLRSEIASHLVRGGNAQQRQAVCDDPAGDVAEFQPALAQRVVTGFEYRALVIKRCQVT